MKESLLVIGAAFGGSLTAFGAFICLGFHGDNSDADALAGAVRLFLGVPCLAVGVPLLVGCAIGLAK